MNPLLEIIAREVEKTGVIPFARYMQLALYCPVYGYYEKKKDNLGRDGDFFTSVSSGSLFGELLAFQFADWLSEFPDGDGRRQIIEAGAHHGQFAHDVLTWLCERRPELFRALRYCIVEPSKLGRMRQAEVLQKFGDTVCWAAELSELKKAEASDGVYGIIFSNELLDAMPVQRFGWDAANKRWFEWGVTLNDGKLAHAKIREPQSAFHPPSLPYDLLEMLPDEFTTETCPAAESWWREAANILRSGRLMTIDYGLNGEEWFLPERRQGTLRGYYRHQLVTDLLANVGEQDLTAHVNFTTIRETGEQAGLKTEAFVSQEKFLVQIAEQMWKHPADARDWNSTRTREFQTLTHPDHLGRSFRVMIQRR